MNGPGASVDVAALAAVAVPLLSAAFIVVGLYGQHLAGRFAAGARKTGGVVVSSRSERRGQDGRAYLPTVRFRLPDGREVETEVAWWAATPYEPRHPYRVTVLCDPEDPTNVATEEAVRGKRSRLVVLAVVGIVLAPFGLWTFLTGFDPAALKEMVPGPW